MYVECGMKLVYFQLMSWPAAGDTHVDRSKGGVTLSKGGVTLNKGGVTSSNSNRILEVKFF